MENESKTSSINEKNGELQEKKPALSFFQRVGRILGLGLLFVLIIFAATWFVFVAPRTEELAAARAELQSAQNQIIDQDIEIARLNDVDAELTQKSLQLDLFRFLAEINNARLALAGNDLEAAQAILIPSQSSLDQFAIFVGQEFAEDIADIQTRLTLAIEGIADNNVRPAATDLEILVNMLLSLDKKLIAE